MPFEATHRRSRLATPCSKRCLNRAVLRNLSDQSLDSDRSTEMVAGRDGERKERRNRGREGGREKTERDSESESQSYRETRRDSEIERL